MNKFRWFGNFEKEEQWLSEMSRQGYHLKKVDALGFYSFTKGVPENRKYRIDFRIFKGKTDLDEYLQLFSDSGWNCVSSSKYTGHYFYSAANSSTDIFSDQQSKAQRYLRYSRSFAYSSIISLLPYTVLYTTGAINVSNVGYLTPGLWDKIGWDFVRSFLFETPFVLLRSLVYLFPLALLAGCVGTLLYSHILRKRILKQDG